jgi:hypothetical protein
MEYMSNGLQNTVRGLLLGAVLWLLNGCATHVATPLAFVHEYKPSNIYKACTFLPPGIRRVAVLPITSDKGDVQAESGKNDLGPILESELGKVKVFERIQVTADQLHALTGRTAWRSEDVLPNDFFEKLQEAFACDAVIFAHLRPYHAYQPIVIGWNLKLIDVKSHTIIWAADEVFDGGKASVTKAALSYWREQPVFLAPTETETVLISPRRFSQYTLCALLETLPPH